MMQDVGEVMVVWVKNPDSQSVLNPDVQTHYRA
jgi:hypothetical protein